MINLTNDDNDKYTFGWQGPFLAGYTPVDSPPLSYGLQRLDHAVGNVPNLEKAVSYIARLTGFHEFAEFTAEVSLHLLILLYVGLDRMAGCNGLLTS